MKIVGKKSYVYLIADTLNEGIFKIGVTKGKIENRIKQLQTGNAGELYIFDYYETEFPYFIEKRMHIKYRDNNVNSEWFKVPLEEALKFKELCSEEEKLVDIMKDNHFFMEKLR